MTIISKLSRAGADKRAQHIKPGLLLNLGTGTVEDDFQKLSSDTDAHTEMFKILL